MFVERTWSAAVAVAMACAAALLASGCGSTTPGADSAATGATGMGSNSPSTAAGTPSPVRPVRPVETTPTPTDPALPLPHTPPADGAEITIRGTVAEGVEAGCLILGEYQLMVSDPQLRDVVKPGANVEVTGQVMDSVISLCQQGRPLAVIAARPV